MHGSAVALDGKGLLIIGASGSGKSATALALIGRGAKLVSDDQVDLTLEKSRVVAHVRKDFEGWIEARGVGILQVPHVRSQTIDYVLDMDQTELHRLPPMRHHCVLGCDIALIHGRENPGLVDALDALLRGGRLK